ncbi:MAG: hypothetical protein Q8N39_03030 [Pelolinea sp.]|nr:hypothetical protein [Pelolinea sp.]
MIQKIDFCCCKGDQSNARELGFTKAFDLLFFVAEIMALQGSY